MIEADPKEIKEWYDQEDAILIDVRESHELDEFSISGALHNPLSAFDISAIPIDTNKKLVIFCAHGMRSSQVAQYLLQENHVSTAYNMTGGVAAWLQGGLPGKDRA